MIKGFASNVSMEYQKIGGLKCVAKFFIHFPLLIPPYTGYPLSIEMKLFLMRVISCMRYFTGPVLELLFEEFDDQFDSILNEFTLIIINLFRICYFFYNHNYQLYLI